MVVLCVGEAADDAARLAEGSGSEPAAGHGTSAGEKEAATVAAATVAAVRQETPPEAAAELEEDEKLQDPGSGGTPPQRPRVSVVVVDTDPGQPVTVQVRGRERAVNAKSLCILSLDNPVRQAALLFVEWQWFDRFILFCIVLNSVLLGIYQHRAQKGIDAHYALNEFIDDTADHIFWGIFTLESVLKIIAWGFICGKGSYLRDPWNALDFLVVASGLVERMGLGAGLDFLRLFRLLRPLRSLNAVPQMKVLVNTALSSILKLGNVVVLGAFLFMVFGIIGISLMNGIFYRQCHSTRHPVELNGCWSWNTTGQERLCGGNFVCPQDSYCGGHEADADAGFRPVFQGGRRGLPWCTGSEPRKLFPETDFVHFDHILGALLLIFQSMTLEGWTDIMYMVEDAFSPWFATIFFIAIVILTNFFMLNVALAVVDEVQDEFVRKQQEQADNEENNVIGSQPLASVEEHEAPEVPLLEGEGTGEAPTEELWLDCCLVRWCRAISQHEGFLNFILVIIAGNVINMGLQWFSLRNPFGHVVLDQIIKVAEITFLCIFIIEMIIMILALGPKGYVKNPITAFDGVVVLLSIVELIVNETSDDGGGGGLSALRTFRLFRVMNKLANKWWRLKVLLKAMLHTGAALNYWLVLFGLVLYIFTLMWMSIFAKQFHFEDVDALAPLVPKQYHNQEWCPNTDDGRSWHYRQDCIPRAHFDTFTWGFVTVFQVMTGENWNTIMYAGMRASQRWEGTIVPPTMLSAGLFVLMILFGQTLFLSLFLSMLISTFDDVQDQFEDEERHRQSLLPARPPRLSQTTVNHVQAFISNIGQRSSQIQSQPQVQTEEQEPDDEPAEDASSSRLEEVVSSELNNTLPGQIPIRRETLEPAEVTETGPQVDEVGSMRVYTPPSRAVQPLGDTSDQEAEPETIPTLRRGWPHGYSLLLFSPSNPLRKGAQWLLAKKVQVWGTTVTVFDNFILVCILLSTLCMMADTPLSDPRHTGTKVLRAADQVFAIIFMVELVVKVVALGLACGSGAYLRSGWNWLDGGVVLVSVVDLASAGEGPGFLRVLRILRTFRPLRVISRNEGLRVVVQTLFVSMGDLLGLVIVSFLFTLIFALILLMYLKGALYQCSPGDQPLRYLRGEASGLGDNFVTPMCLGADPNSGMPLATMRGALNQASGVWSVDNASCGAPTSVAWQRPSADTPICLGRCDPTVDSHGPGVERLCRRKYTTTQELPSLCPDARAPGRELLHSTLEQEEVGFQYIEDMVRTLTLPCGGFSAAANGSILSTTSGASCRETFCADVGEPSPGCVADCKSHHYFCKHTCKADAESLECQLCRKECEASCMCDTFCQPLILDAALCHEQGGTWGAVLSQNFDTIVNSVLSLFEISTTEGWVDVMYAAADSTDTYRQPVRDNNHGPYVFLFPLWILLSFMFLINLAVGVIVDNFEKEMEEREQQHDMLTDSQRRWVKSQRGLEARAYIYDLTDLHLLPPNRRRLYNFISSKRFEHFIMFSIVVNTLIMALTIFPAPWDWWSDFQQAANYVFAAVFTVEAMLKLTALRCNYWLDSWNRFDFVCVVATLVGIVLKLPAFDLDVGAATSVIRILRIARLFRLLRFLRELNRLFMCLLISIPKLYNVMMILCLFLVLFSILGMSLFGTAKFPAEDPTLNVHGNFQTFLRGFVTLFRASTGEAWNEIMHNLAKDEKAYFREGDWCTPQHLFRTRSPETFAVLEEKCLISNPNACPGSWNPFPAIYWVCYTLLITFMIMNLVVAVILKGYEEGKADSESDNIDMCIEVWKRFDPEHKMCIPLPDALRFLGEAMSLCNSENAANVELPVLEGHDFHEMARNADMRLLSKFARLAVEMNVVQGPDQVPNINSLPSEVTFQSATRQALKLMSARDVSDEALQELNVTDSRHVRRSLDVWPRTQQRNDSDFLAGVAAAKIQDQFRHRRASVVSSDGHQVATEESGKDDVAPFEGPRAAAADSDEAPDAGVPGVPAG